jgi:PTH2 family peptidyl-tRNA hydrolase
MSYNQVFIINQSLDMSKGKVAVQTAHGEVFYMHHLNEPHSCGNWVFSQWMKDGVMKKIALKAPEQELLQIAKILEQEKIWFHIVKDLGLTQIQAGSSTCIVVEPLLEEKAKKLFGHLKLL